MIKFAEIEEAQNRINNIVKHTNLEYSDFFSQTSGHQVYFKTENLQYTNSFKPRGASNFVLQLNPDITARGVVAQPHLAITVKEWPILLQKWGTHV